jgi:hypothetical protein
MCQITGCVMQNIKWWAYGGQSLLIIQTMDRMNRQTEQKLLPDNQWQTNMIESQISKTLGHIFLLSTSLNECVHFKYT